MSSVNLGDLLVTVPGIFCAAGDCRTSMGDGGTSGRD